MRMMKEVSRVLSLAAVACGAWAAFAETYAPRDPATVWNREELYKTPKIWNFQTPFKGEVTPMWIEGEPYQGKPTRCFTLLGIPEGASAEHKVPGIVLIHGGAGTTYPEWVRLWTRRGYAAITVDNCGCLPIQIGEHRWLESPFGGPHGWGEVAVKHVDEPLREQWMYHAIAASVRAHSYLRSLDCVDTSNIGVTGISWGGFQTCIIAAVDERFAYAVPVYGCGFNYEDGGIMSIAQFGDDTVRWSKLWDPVVYLPFVKIPMLWVDGTNDFAFSLDRVMRSAALAQGESQFCTRLRMPHGHGAPGEAPEEILSFADHYARGARDIVRISPAALSGRRLTFTFKANGHRLAKAELLWTEDGVDIAAPKRLWNAKTLDGFDFASGAAAVELPEKTFQAIVNLVDDAGLIFSTGTVQTR